jgi:non-specific serine/threonine protein kinase
MLAEIAGLSVETIGALERGTRRGPYRTTVDAIAEALRIGDAERLELLGAADRSRARTITQDARAGSALSTLPGQSTSCIGREREIAEILGLLRESRMVTITGSAGIGKTRTLLEIAAALPASRRNDVRFVDLTVLEGGEYLLSCIAAACGSSEAAHVETIDRLTEFLRPQRLLILLDNCEHLVENVALVVASIRRTCPDVAFLATSRERLAISEETI